MKATTTGILGNTMLTTKRLLPLRCHIGNPTALINKTGFMVTSRVIIALMALKRARIRTATPTFPRQVSPVLTGNAKRAKEGQDGRLPNARPLLAHKPYRMHRVIPSTLNRSYIRPSTSCSYMRTSLMYDRLSQGVRKEVVGYVRKV